MRSYNAVSTGLFTTAGRAQLAGDCFCDRRFFSNKESHRVPPLPCDNGMNNGFDVPDVYGAEVAAIEGQTGDIRHQ